MGKGTSTLGGGDSPDSAVYPSRRSVNTSQYAVSRCLFPRELTFGSCPYPSVFYKHEPGPDTGFAPQEDVCTTEACCLAWILTQSCREEIEEERLFKFHSEIAGYLRFFGCEILVDGATSGIILGHSFNSGVTAADALVRMGQLLCRWAAAQVPALDLRVGVHIGRLRAMSLPNSAGRRAYFGDACDGARKLADTAKHETLVHMSLNVKEHLCAFRLVRLTLSPNHTTFYLDPATEVQFDDRASRLGSDAGLAMRLSQDGTLEERMDQMPFESFVRLLEDHEVDTSKFGVGSAKTLEEFYSAVVKDEKSFLVVKSDRIERVVELVRISLRTRDNDSKLRELRIQSQETSHGNLRLRNQPLAMVLRVGEQGQWREAIERCFTMKFNLSASAQKMCFFIDKDAYTFKEERAHSDTIPGIVTTYKSHNIVITVVNKAKPELHKLGLPNSEDFTTGTESGAHYWTWVPVVDNKEDELTSILVKGGVDVSEFTWYAFAELHDEIYDKMQSRLEERDGELQRTIRIIRVWLHADILNLDHVLVTRAKHQKGRHGFEQEVRGLSMRMSAGQEWEDAVDEALLLRLGIPLSVQRTQLSVDTASKKDFEEIKYSRTYPGLKTLYVVNEVNVHILDPRDRQWQFIGLPGGTDFAFTRRETLTSKSGASDIVITQFGWQLAHEVFVRTLSRTLEKQPSLSDKVNSSEYIDDKDEVIKLASMAKRVNPPAALIVLEHDELVLRRLMHGKQTDWLRARRAAECICDPGYKLKDFYEDISHAFPELRLYCIKHAHIATDPVDQVSSARSPDDEYQRTIGALFAVFWLMRMRHDGKESFCFGVDRHWNPRSPMKDLEVDQSFLSAQSRQNEMRAEHAKRLTFYEKTDWAMLECLLVQSGLLEQEGGPHNVDRTLTFLVLMTIHDIMKLELLRPTIGVGMEEFGGYKAGETIGDHDVALSYVLDHCPQALPSFAGLPATHQEFIKFAHCKLEYNMGWLVQAEAPPGALFKSFRKVIIAGQAAPSDIAFYFVHWFADLAGAEPYPLQGSEKFVLKFPQKVLGNFIDSFSVVWTLGPDRTETQVFEDYLLWRWSNHDPDLGDPPTGPGSIAKMRLVLMAQGDSAAVLKEFSMLPDEDRLVLSDELAMTGCAEQSFERDSLGGSRCAGRGPAILVYYSPALMQKAGRKDPRCTLMVLAEVFRRTRELWPLSLVPTEVDRSVIVRIDALKDLEMADITQPKVGHSFVVVKSSSQDGVVKLLPLSSFRSLNWSANRILDFSARKMQGQPSLATGGAMSNLKKRLSRRFTDTDLAGKTKSKESKA